MKIIIPIHSFIDLITNSSSETYVCCDDKTVEAVYELIEALFNQAAHPGLKGRDFFDVSLTTGERGNSGTQIGSIVIQPKNAADPKQLAVCEAVKKIFNSISAEEIYNG